MQTLSEELERNHHPSLLPVSTGRVLPSLLRVWAGLGSPGSWMVALMWGWVKDLALLGQSWHGDVAGALCVSHFPPVVLQPQPVPSGASSKIALDIPLWIIPRSCFCQWKSPHGNQAGLQELWLGSEGAGASPGCLLRAARAVFGAQALLFCPGPHPGLSACAPLHCHLWELMVFPSV